MGGLGLRIELDICPCSDSLPACECVAISSFTGERFSRGTDSVCAVLLGELRSSSSSPDSRHLLPAEKRIS